MKNIEKKIAGENIADPNSAKMTRKQAIRKTGYYAVSAATMMILLSNPNKANAQAASTPAPPPAGNYW